MNLHCFLQGDQHSRRGALTGGFYDSQKSRLDLQRKLGEAKKKLEEQDRQLKLLKEKITDILSYTCDIRNYFFPVFRSLLSFI